MSLLMSLSKSDLYHANRDDDPGFPEKWFGAGGKWLSPVSLGVSLGIGAFLLWKNSQRCREIQDMKIQIINNQRYTESERRISEFSDYTLLLLRPTDETVRKRLNTVMENRYLLNKMRSLDELEKLGVMWHDSCNSWFPSRDRVQLLEER
ncbi:hypothetical protein WMY93_031345 [Mugilogobius chulae]|uniref:Uncharacterized protein n=1 Tax=Mugilogobius chulae TaxID=88201 RepID=A0AAW0MIQ4_9GOBI